MLASKAGAKRVSLQLLFKEDIPSGGLLFTFTNLNTREDDRKLVQDLLIPFVAANKNVTSIPGPSAPSPIAASPGSPSLKRKRDEPNREINILRKAVLNKHPDLKKLHRALVLSDQISEEEFWSGREVCLFPPGLFISREQLLMNRAL